MRWSWKIGRIAGIELRVHATFLILLAWAALVGYQADRTAAGTVSGVLFILALFASVVLHELGHALVAKRFGVPTQDITLLPIGGVARLESIPKAPRQELRVAAAGPAVTLVIAALLYGALQLLGNPISAPGNVLITGAGFLSQLLWANVTLLLFNLLPAFPMDGGRMFRAILALRWDYVRATEAAARIGKAFALVFGVVGLFYNPFLVLIALFVWMGAAAESADVQGSASLEGVTVEQVMVRDVRTLAPGDSLNEAINHVLSGFQQDFPVVQDGEVVGVLTRTRMLEALAKRGADQPVGEAMETQFCTAMPREPVEQVLTRLRSYRCRSMPVISDHRLDGLVTMDTLGEFIMIAAALHRTSPQPPGVPSAIPAGSREQRR